MFVRPPRIPNHSGPFAQYAPPSSHGYMYLKWLSIHRSVRLIPNMLIRIPEKYTPTALRNAGQLKLRVSKRNTRSHNKVPRLYPLHYLPTNSWISQQQQRAVTLVAHSLLLCIQEVPTGITAVSPTNSMSTHYYHFESQLTLLIHSYALKGCINCRQAEQSGVNPLCKACDDTLSQYAPVLVQVPSDNKIFWDSKH